MSDKPMPDTMPAKTEDPAIGAAKKMADDAAPPQIQKPGIEAGAKDRFKDFVNQPDTLEDKWNKAVTTGRQLWNSTLEAARETKEFAAKVRPMTDADKERLPKLIALMGAGIDFHSDTDARKSFSKELKELGMEGEYNSYQIREAAQAAIKKMGAPACAKLEEAIAQNPNPEISARANRLLGGIVNANALTDIDRPGNGKGMDQINKMLNIQGLLLDPGDDRRAYQIKEAQRFAENPELTKKRIDTIEQALGHVATGDLHLSTERIQRLRQELKNLKEIGPVCAKLELDQAQSVAYNDPRQAKDLLASALKHNKDVVKDRDFIDVMVRCSLDKNDPDFMKTFVAMGGDPKAVAQARMNREENSKYPNHMETPIPQQLPPQGFLPPLQVKP